MTSSDISSLEMIRRFVESPTVSRDSNLELIEFVRDYLAGLGVESHVFRNAEKTKASIYATLGPADRPGIMLAGHTDVVPVDGQEWHTDPWKLVEKDGKLFGRGTTDMKSFCAIALASAPLFLERSLETPIHYGFTFEEEINRVGINAILDGIEDFPVRPAMCIVGEPSENEGRRRPQGKEERPLPRERVRVPLVARADGRQRHRIRCRTDRPYQGPVAGIRRRRPRTRPTTSPSRPSVSA